MSNKTRGETKPSGRRREMGKPTDYNYWLGVVGFFCNTEAATALNAEFNRLEARLAAAEAVCEAADLERKERNNHRAWDHRKGCPACDATEAKTEALETWRKMREDKDE